MLPGTKFVLVFALEILCLILILLKLAPFTDLRYFLGATKIKCTKIHTEEKNVCFACLKINSSYI